MGLVTPTEPVPLDELGRVHFVGIGGAGMSGIARIMLDRGTKVSGSDSGASAALDELAALGARVHVGHAAGQLGDADTLVVSSAIRESNPELAEARSRGLRVVHRAAALASLMFGRRVIAVTGTHGKTTTTSMIATVLLETGSAPAYAIGGVLAATGIGRRRRPGQGLRRGGRRERRLVPDVLAGCGRRHQRRRRPPGQLRDRAGLPRLVRRPSSAGSSRAGCSSPPPTTPARGISPPRRARRGEGRQVRRVAGRRLPGHERNDDRHGNGAVGQPPGRPEPASILRASRSAFPATTTR